MFNLKLNQCINSYTGEVIYELDSFESQYKSFSPSESSRGFVWATSSLFRLIDQMDNGTITRMMYLATFSNYNGQIVGSKGHDLDDAAVKKLLLLSDKESGRFLNDMLNLNVINQAGDSYKLNTSYFFKGNIGEFYSKNPSCKLYVDGIRRLYKTLPPRSHKRAGYIFKLMPYVHRQTNILCKNPSEFDLGKVIFLNKSEIAEKLTDDKSHIARTINNLLDPILDDDGYNLTLLTKKEIIINGKLQNVYIVNPELYYGGRYITLTKDLFGITSTTPHEHISVDIKDVDYNAASQQLKNTGADIFDAEFDDWGMFGEV